MGRRKSQNTIKSLCTSLLLTFVSLLTQLRLKTIGGCDSLVQRRYAFYFFMLRRMEGRGRKAMFIENSAVPATVLDAFRCDLI